MKASRALLVLAVAVMVGTVSVEYDGQSHKLAAGAERTFGAKDAEQKWSEGRAQAERKIAEMHERLLATRKRHTLPGQGKGRVIGFVIDAETGEPPKGAVIVGFKGQQAEDARPEKRGELRGMYELTVDPGNWKIAARATGYQTATVESVRVAPGHGSGMGTWLIFRLEKGRQEAAQQQPLGKIEAGRPTHRAMKHEAWRYQGRIVGRLRQAPVCEIDALDSSGDILQSTRVKQGAARYSPRARIERSSFGTSRPAAKTIRVWSVKDGQCLKTIQQSGAVRAIAISPDGKFFATGGEDAGIPRNIRPRPGQEIRPVYYVRAWTLNTGRETGRIEAHRWIVESLDFSPDGTTIVSGSFDGTVKLWNTKTGGADPFVLGAVRCKSNDFIRA